MTALLLGWSNVIILDLIFPGIILFAPINFFLGGDFSVHVIMHLRFCVMQKYPDNLAKAAELAVSSLQVLVHLICCA